MTIYLSSTDSIELISSIAVPIDVYVSYVDLATTTNVATPSRQATNITTATTTTITSAPSANTVRKVKSIRIRNKSNLFDSNVTVNQTNGTSDYQVFADNLGPGRTILIQNDTTKLLKSGGTQTPKWHGVIYGGFGDGNPNKLLQMMQCNGASSLNPASLYQTIDTTEKTCRACFCYFPANITVKNIRFYGTGNTTDRLSMTMYERGTGTAWDRVFDEITFSTSADTWGTVNSSDLSLSLTANKMYMMAVRSTASFSASAVLSIGPGTAQPNSMIYVPTANHISYINDYINTLLITFPTSSGVFPSSIASLLLSDWSWGAGSNLGSMPAFFLDSQ